MFEAPEIRRFCLNGEAIRVLDFSEAIEIQLPDE
jgi:hypothetical protein